jgi:hypothetical protein
MAKFRMRLQLKRLTDSSLDEYAQQKIEKLAGNTFYPPLASFPELAAVIAKQQLYSNALAETFNGNTIDTVYKKKERTDLENLLTTLAMRCKHIANGDAVVFLSSGFNISVRHSSAQPLPAPASFTLTDGGNETELIAKFSRVINNHGYELWLSLTPIITDASIILTSSKTKVLISGLESGKKYYAWVRAIGAYNTHGNWSDISSRIPQ